MKKLTYLFSVLFTFLLTCGALAQTMNAEAVQPFNDGLTKIQKGDYKGALADFGNALKFDKDYRIYYQIGVAQENLNNNTEAIAAFKNTIKVNPEFDAVYNDLGNVYYKTGNYQEAINNFQKVIEISKDTTLKNTVKFNIALSYFNLGTAAEKAKNNKKAIGYYEEAIKYDNYDVAYLYLAKDYFVLNQYDKAIQAGENALKYKKDISEGGPNYYIGVAYSKKNDLKKAKEYLMKAKSDPVYGKFAQTVLDAINK